MLKGESYHALTSIDFNCIKTENIFIDFAGKEISTLKINQVKIDKSIFTQHWKEGHLDLSNFINEGKNNIVI